MMIRIVSLIALMMAISCEEVVEEKSSSRQLSESLGSGDLSSFQKADKPRAFVFPQDHGPHRAFKTEWWYVTGNVVDENGRPFGYQFTIFRIGNSPTKASTVENDWKSSEFFMGHFTITDVTRQKFFHDEMFSRGGIGNAGSNVDSTWLNAMKVRFEQTNNGQDSLIVTGKMKDASATFFMTSQKNAVLQGENGLSQKGREVGNASYYYSLTRLATKGNITVEGQSYEIVGDSWLDREWSTSMLEADQSGWDWFSLQLDNGHELMYYQLRDKNQKAGPTSAGVIVFPSGDKERVSYKNVRLDVMEMWKSPYSGDEYPSGWKLSVDNRIMLTILPKMKNQELDAAVRYWEGAVEITGIWADNDVSGNGYVELTGYSQ